MLVVQFSFLVDQVFANEEALDDVLWGLGDHQNTVRDVVRYDDTTNDTTIENTLTYDAFGKVISETAGVDDFRFKYTGKFLDDVTGLQYNINRWYDPNVGRWISEDPIGFTAGDTNLARYVGNSPGNYIDPDGREKWLFPWDRNASWNPYDTAKLWFGNNPIKHVRGLYTGETELTPDTVEAFEGAGQSYTRNAGNAHTALEIVDHYDPTGLLASGTSELLACIEGDQLHLLAMQNVNPQLLQVKAGSEKLSQAIQVINVGKNIKKGLQKQLGAKSGSSKHCPVVQTKGGTYKLKDSDGVVKRTGRSKDLKRRAQEHARDPKTKDLEFEVDRRTDIPSEQRGREQIIYENYPEAKYENGGLNKIRAIRDNHPKLDEFIKAGKNIEK